MYVYIYIYIYTFKIKVGVIYICIYKFSCLKNDSYRRYMRNFSVYPQARQQHLSGSRQSDRCCVVCDLRKVS